MRKRPGFFAYWPSQIKVFLMFLILVASGILLVAADFGESSDSLGQITDEFDTLDNVSVTVDTVRNSTFNAMELNWTAGNGEEDFSTYTEVDSGNDITKNATRITWDTMRRNEQSWVYFDYGAGTLDDWTYNFTVAITDVEAGDASNAGTGTFASLSNMIGSFADTIASDSCYVSLLQNGATDDTFRFRIFQYSGGVQKIQTNGGIRGLGTYYLTFRKSGDNLYLYVYSDSARTVLVETISDVTNGVDDSYRYLYGVQSWDSASDPDDHSSGYIEHLWDGTLGAGYVESGYFTTTDYISGINGSVLVQLTNTTIPAGTGITAEFSPDNSTWVNDKNASGAVTLTDGFNAVDLRELNWSAAHYVRYNMTGTGSETPRLYQSRLITTEGAAGSAPGTGAVTVVESDAPWIAIAIILMCVAYLLLR